MRRVPTAADLNRIDRLVAGIMHHDMNIKFLERRWVMQVNESAIRRDINMMRTLQFGLKEQLRQLVNELTYKPPRAALVL
uniref:AsIV-cont00217-ORF1 n=1 Tax=Apophua simplicipes ichnovirus TaxID=1329648 RepID=S5DMS1_9VIRU|nr:AsIV-cont00217-ORF1 [Apophua simplicipes ichnovirus]